MPLILCPSCGRVTYAFPRYDDEGEITSYRCSDCYNVFNYYQVNILPFPNEEIILSDTFESIVIEVLQKELDSYDDIINALECLSNIEIHKYKYVMWDYVGTRESDEYNDEMFEEVQREFTPYVDKNFYIIELREMDEGDSIFIAVNTQDAEKLAKALKQYTLTRNKYNDAITPS